MIGMKIGKVGMKASSLLGAFPVAVLLSVGGCGLISSDILRVTVDLPTQTYTFNTSQWGSLPPAANGATLPSIPCGTDSDCCTAGTAAGISCTMPPVVCKSAVCEIDVPVSQASRIDLATDAKPSLSQYTSFVSISISKIQYAVSNNSLNVDVPPISIYLAPDGVTNATDPRAVLFGTVATIPAGKDPTGDVQLVSNAATVFQTFTGNLSTPFSIIAATTVVVAGGTPVPAGAITVAVTGTFSAQP